MDPIGVFQPLCRDVLKLESEVTDCVGYGVNGQSQHGIDLLAETIKPDTRIAAQCKCYQQFTKPNLRDACELFWNHLGHWKAHNVRRFVLMVACAVERSDVIESRMEWQQRFVSEGITFELWDGNALRDRLSSHRTIAERHIRSEEIVNNICGKQQIEPTLDEQDTPTLLKQLRLALKEPAKHRDLLEEFLVREAQALWQVVSSNDSIDWNWNGNLSASVTYLQTLQNRSERFVKALAWTVRYGDDAVCIPLVKTAMGLLSQWPPQPGHSYYPHVAGVRLYPLMLAVYAVVAVAVDRKKFGYIHLLQGLGWRSVMKEQRYYKHGVRALELVQMEWGTAELFKHGLLEGQNYYAPAVLSTKRLLSEWLRELFVDFEEAWWRGEFMLVLCFLALSELKYLPSTLLIYIPEASAPIERLLTQDQSFLDSCFDDIADVLGRFDVAGVNARNGTSFQRTNGFWSGALKLYNDHSP